MGRDKPRPKTQGEAVDKKIRETGVGERLREGFRRLEGKEIES